MSALNMTIPAYGDAGGSGGWVNDLIAALLNIDASAMFSVKAYGATGDGTTDDFVAIAAAIAAADAVGGGTVWFAPGTYRISATVEIPDNVLLLGAGQWATTIDSQFAGPQLSYTQTQHDLIGFGYRSGIANMTLHGETSGSTFYNTANLEVIDSFKFSVMNVVMEGAVVGMLVRAVDFWVENMFLLNVHIRTFREAGIRCRAEAGAPEVAGFGASFGFWQVIGLVMNVLVDGAVGIDFGHTGIAASFMSWDISGNFYLDTDNTRALLVRDNAQVAHNFWRVHVDTFGSGLRQAVEVESGGQWSPTGYVGDGARTFHIGIVDDIQVHISTPGGGPAVTRTLYDGQALLVPQEAEHQVSAAGEPEFGTGWTNYGSGAKQAVFWRDTEGVVHLAGSVKRTSGTNAVVFTLPLGWRPIGGTEYFGAIDGSNCVGVTIAGEVTAVGTFNAAHLSLNGITFRAVV